MDADKLKKFIEGRCDAAMLSEVQAWLQDPVHAEQLRILLASDWNAEAGGKPIFAASDRDRLWISLTSQLHISKPDAMVEGFRPTRRLILFPVFRIVAAAVLIGILFTWYTLVFTRGAEGQVSDPAFIAARSSGQDIEPPAAARATLTLADGRRIYLDSTREGVLLREGALAVSRDDLGAIIYDTEAASAVVYHTLSLPRGSRPLRLVLADGSAVWLNAASSITYPTGFRGKERAVSMTGEAYFEVAHDPEHPFIVAQGDVRIRVLGTHFNVRTYADAVQRQVTLLEGSVTVLQDNQSGTLKPGQQASLETGGLSIQVVDTESVMAWKNGQFIFDGADLRTILQEISRYYDVDVVFQDEIPYRFVARISRDVPVSALLEKLSLTGLVRFRIEGGKILVHRSQ